MTNPEQREKIARALNEIDERDYGLSDWDNLDETARAYRYQQADAIIALDPAPESWETDDRCNCGLAKYGPGDHSDWCLFKPLAYTPRPAPDVEAVGRAIALVRRIGARENWQSHYGKRWEDEAAEIVADLDATLARSSGS